MSGTLAEIRNPAASAVLRAAPAKLNLYLHVTGRRPDGYHLLDSLIAFAAIHDSVAVREADSLTLTAEGPFAADLPESGGNIVLKAAKAFREHAGVRTGAEIRLTKRLPVASGIGGGSADVAACLRALDSVWRCNADENDLMTLALEIGADVPACLHGRAAFVGGIGEKIADAPPLPPAHLVLVNPRKAVATAEVFAARQGAFGKAARFSEAPKDLAELAFQLVARRNDLAPAAIALCPEISEAIGALARISGCRLARMSGSGATCFGLFEDEISAKRAAGSIVASEPGWWVVACPLVTDTAKLEPRG